MNSAIGLLLVTFALLLAFTSIKAQTPKPPKPAIYCGAITKKGTPCKRRVKAQGLHCFMHQTKEDKR